MFAEVLNPYLNTHNKVKNKYGIWEDMKVESQTDILKKRLVTSLKYPGDEFQIFNVKNKMVIIDQFNIINKVDEGKDENTTQILLDSKNADEEGNNIFNNQHFVLYSNRGDTFLTVPKIKNYINHHSEYLETYGEVGQGDKKNYRLRLKNKIILPEGGRLYFQNYRNNVGFGEVEFIIKYREIDKGV